MFVAACMHACVRGMVPISDLVYVISRQTQSDFVDFCEVEGLPAKRLHRSCSRRIAKMLKWEEPSSCLSFPLRGQTLRSDRGQIFPTTSG